MRTATSARLLEIALVLAVTSIGSEALALSVCSHAIGGVHGSGSFGGHERVPRGTMLWARVCGANGRQMPDQLVEQAPSSLLEDELQPALVADRWEPGGSGKYARGAVVLVPGYRELVYRIEPSTPLLPNKQYRFIVYERQGDQQLREAFVFGFETAAELADVDRAAVDEWAGPTAHDSRQVAMGQFEWTAHRLLIGSGDRIPPMVHVDSMAAKSPLATPLFSELMFPTATGTLFEGFKCGCGSDLQQVSDPKLGIQWMRMTAVATDGERGATFWVRLIDGRLESLADETAAGAVRRWIWVGLSALVALLLSLGLYFRRRRRHRSGDG